MEQEKTFEKKQELINAALKEFGEYGYENASLNNILKEAKISKGTFYYHFENKEDLYFYLIQIIINEKKKFFITRFTTDLLNRNIFEIFKELIKIGLEFANHNKDISKISEQFLKEKDKNIYHKIIDRLKINVQSNELIDGLITAAYHKKEIRQDFPLDLAKKIINYIFLHMTEMTDTIEVKDFEHVANYLIEFMKNGLFTKDS